MPLVPPPEDPPHGKDPRYWLDVSKIILVPDGQLAPYGYKQIGPAFSTPTRNRHILTTAAPAKYPLDVTDIVTRAPGDVGPSRYQELSPGVWAPDPSAGYQAQPPWPAPQQPIVGRLRRPRGHGPTAEVKRSASIDVPVAPRLGTTAVTDDAEVSRSASIDVPVAPRLGTTAVTDDAAMSTNRDDLLDLSGLAAADHRGELVAVGAVAFGARPVEVALHGAHRHR